MFTTIIYTVIVRVRLQASNIIQMVTSLCSSTELLASSIQAITFALHHSRKTKR